MRGLERLHSLYSRAVWPTCARGVAQANRYSVLGPKHLSNTGEHNEFGDCWTSVSQIAWLWHKRRGCIFSALTFVPIE